MLSVEDNILFCVEINSENEEEYDINLSILTFNPLTPKNVILRLNRMASLDQKHIFYQWL